MKLAHYMQLLKKHGRFDEVMILLSSSFLIFMSLYSLYYIIVSVIYDGIGSLRGLWFGLILYGIWGVLGIVIILKIFKGLEEKENQTGVTMKNDEISVHPSDNASNTISTIRSFMDWIPSILLLVNIVVLVLLLLQPSDGAAGLDAIFFGIPILIVVTAIPFVIFAHLGTFKTFSTIFSYILLVPPLLWLVPLLISIL